jgi:hypothetical protein
LVLEALEANLGPENPPTSFYHLFNLPSQTAEVVQPKHLVPLSDADHLKTIENALIPHWRSLPVDSIEPLLYVL